MLDGASLTSIGRGQVVWQRPLTHGDERNASDDAVAVAVEPRFGSVKRRESFSFVQPFCRSLPRIVAAAPHADRRDDDDDGLNSRAFSQFASAILAAASVQPMNRNYFFFLLKFKI